MSHPRGRRWLSIFIGLNVFHLLSSAVYGDVIIDIVCLLDSSAFPTATYDSILKKSINCTLVTPTMTRADLVTGAEAKQRYFPDSTVFRRFELLHVTRVRSVLQISTNGVVVPTNSFGAGLIKAISRDIGACGIDSISDSSITTASQDDMQWILNMPVLVAPIALAGWVITVVSCSVCWFCVCCTTDTKIATVADTSTTATPDPVVVGIVAAPPLTKPVKANQTPSTKAIKQPITNGPRSEMFPQIPTPAPTFHPLSSLTSSIDFQHQSSRYLELRIPSFKGSSPVPTT